MTNRVRTKRRDAGFAAITVIWGLGLIALIAATVMAGARARSRDMSSAMALAAASAAADSGIALGLLRAKAPVTERPLRCVLPGGERLTLTIAQEAGKIDLNAAPAPLLARLFAALGEDDAKGAQIAARIIEFRRSSRDGVDRKVSEDYLAQNKPEGPMRGAFTSILELDQVADVTPALFRRALPFVTVHSAQAEFDANLATTAMRKLLGLPLPPDDQPGQPAQASPQATTPPPQAAGAPQTERVVTITADIAVGSEVRFIRDALVAFGKEPKARTRMVEWRRGDPLPPPKKPEQTRNDPRDWQACLPMIVTAR